VNECKPLGGGGGGSGEGGGGGGEGGGGDEGVQVHDERTCLDGSGFTAGAYTRSLLSST